MQEETTSIVRGWGGLMFVVGVVACFTPFLPLGVVLSIVGGAMWWMAPANAKRTQQMVTEAEESGGGCLAGLAAALFAVIVMLLAGVLAMAAVGGLAA